MRYIHDHSGEIIFKREVVAVSALTRMKRAAAVLAAASLPLGLTGCMGAAVSPPVMGAAVALPEPPAEPVTLMGAPPPPPETHVAARSGNVKNIANQLWAIVPDDEPSMRICLDGPLATSALKTEGKEVVFSGTPEATPPEARLACQPFAFTTFEAR